MGFFVIKILHQHDGAIALVVVLEKKKRLLFVLKSADLSKTNPDKTGFLLQRKKLDLKLQFEE